jgi:hypothetical protein
VRRHERPGSDTSRTFRMVLGAYPKTEEDKSGERQHTQH